MGDKFVTGLKFAFAGSAVALGVGLLVDTVHGQVMNIVNSSGISHDMSTYVMVATGGTLAVAGLLAGDQVLSSIVSGEDPLYHMFYYQLAFQSCNAAYAPLGLLRSFANQGIQSMRSVGRQSTPIPQATGGCGKPACGAGQ